MKNNILTIKQFIELLLIRIKKAPYLEFSLVLLNLLSIYQYSFSSVGILLTVFCCALKIIFERKVTIYPKAVIVYSLFAILTLFSVFLGDNINLAIKISLTYIYALICITCFSSWIDFAKLKKIYFFFGFVTTIPIFFQFIQVFFLKQKISPIPILPIPTEPYINERFFYLLDRPVGFFLEPSQFSTFIIIPTILAIREKKYLLYGLFSLSMFLSLSSIGIFFSVLLLGTISIKYVTNKKSNSMWKLIMLVLVSFALILVFFTRINEYFLVKVFETGRGSTISRLIYGFELFLNLPLINAIFGTYRLTSSAVLYSGDYYISINSFIVPGYQNGISLIMTLYGVIGFMLLLSFLLEFIKIARSNSLLLLVALIFLMISSSMLPNTVDFISIFSVFLLCVIDDNLIKGDKPLVGLIHMTYAMILKGFTFQKPIKSTSINTHDL